MSYYHVCGDQGLYAKLKNPFESQGFAGFWLRVEREWAEKEKFDEHYGLTGCDFCDDWYNCPDCPSRLEQEEEDKAEERFWRVRSAYYEDEEGWLRGADEYDF